MGSEMCIRDSIKRGYEHFTDKLGGLGANFDVTEQ